MLIDWFTVVAQLVNFTVLVVLMKHFFFARLVKAIDGRESRIAHKVAEAETKKREADLRIEGMDLLMEEAERRRLELLERTRHDAAELRARMTHETRESVEALEKKWKDDLDREKAVFLHEARQKIAGQMVAAMRRALADLACADLDHCAVQVFVSQLKTFDPEAIRATADSGDLTVLTAGELREDEKTNIRRALEEWLTKPVSVRFEASSEITWGLELRADGRRIGWNSQSYLDSLENSLDEALQRPKVSALEELTSAEDGDLQDELPAIPQDGLAAEGSLVTGSIQ